MSAEDTVIVLAASYESVPDAEFDPANSEQLAKELKAAGAAA